MVSKPSVRRFPYSEEEILSFEAALAESAIRPLQLPQIFPGIERVPVEIGAIDPDTAHPNQVDMLYVCAIARHVRARRIFEFGTYLGRTTYHLALGPDAEQVYTLDLDPEAEYPGLKLGVAVRAVLTRFQGHFFRDSPVAGKVTQLHSDSRLFDYASLADSIDFVFVDGGHGYEMVWNDTRGAQTVLRPGGVMVWHDFSPKGSDVVRFAREFSADRSLFWIRDTSLLVHLDGVDAMSFEAESPPYAREKIKPTAA